jgi:tryptophanyl-tRNA synthetase
MSMVTDPARIRKDDPGHPEVCTAFAYHKLVNGDGAAETEAQCRAGSIGCVQCKKNLYSKMAEKLTPIYEKRQEILSKPDYMDYIKGVIQDGNARAGETAQKTMKEVREAMKIDW